jgi:dihydropteroate synthase
VKAPRRRLLAAGLELELGSRPLLMGIVNASPDSFSDGGVHAGLDAQVALGRRLLGEGAELLDVGGESATTGRPPVAADEEIGRVVPLVERLADTGALISVDTYKPAVARAAIEAGARIVNDVSGLRDPELATVCAETGAALVLMHTAAAPRERRQDPGLYEDVVEEVLVFLRERIELALAAGVERDQLIVDPGPDFAKTPAQTVQLLASLGRLHELGRPVLVAVSRKDFIGALTGRTPRERTAGTLAALAHGVEEGGHLFRLHDILAAGDYLAVRAALRRESALDEELRLPEAIRHSR